MAERRQSWRDQDQERSRPVRPRRLQGLENGIDAYDQDQLRRFVTEHGKIVPARFTGASAKQQRMIKRAVRRARVMGLVP